MAFLRFQFLLERCLGKRRRQPAAADGRILQVDVGFQRIEFNSGISRGAQDASLSSTPDGDVLQPAISGRFTYEWRIDLEDVRDANGAAAFLDLLSA